MPRITDPTDPHYDRPLPGDAPKRIDKCPECGGRIQTSIKVYIDDVVLVQDADDVRIESSYDQSKDIGVEMPDDGFYCENDHPLGDYVYDTFGTWPVEFTVDGGKYRAD